MVLGTVYWITGLSGAGKTTIGKTVYNIIHKNKDNVVLLDGDTLRDVFGNDLGYDIDDRKKSAMRNARICALLASQGIDVICCTISMFDFVRDWKRKNISNYKEIYIKVPEDVLLKRNQKGMYSADKKDLVGFGIAMEEPKSPDITVINDGSIAPEKIAMSILEKIHK